MSAAANRQALKVILILDAVTVPIITVAFIVSMVQGDALGAGSSGLLLGMISLRSAQDYGRWLRVR